MGSLVFRHDRRSPPMRPATRRFLDHLFAHENGGPADLIGRDVQRVWYRGT